RRRRVGLGLEASAVELGELVLDALELRQVDTVAKLRRQAPGLRSTDWAAMVGVRADECLVADRADLSLQPQRDRPCRLLVLSALRRSLFVERAISRLTIRLSDTSCRIRVKAGFKGRVQTG